MSEIKEVTGYEVGGIVYPTKEAALAAANRETYERSAQAFVDARYEKPALKTRAKNTIVDYLSFMAARSNG